MDESTATTKGKEALPETGQASNNNGLLGAFAAMLAGLGLIKKSRKDRNEKQSK
ncbi:LPXTG cell wall anchor domain-containing protein [Staphylococcus canis]|nr:LPXTG cell wall anchor domain-containing protein [Staphylococcus canis]